MRSSKINDVTVVLGVKNPNEVRLCTLFKSLKRQTYPEKLITICVVDYGSSDEQAHALRKLCLQYRIRRIRIDSHLSWNRSHCLNIGIRASETAFILIGDTGSFFSENYLEECVTTSFESPNTALFSTMLDLPKDISWDLPMPKLRAFAGNSSAFHNRVIFTQAQNLKQLQGYNEIKSGGDEDRDLVQRLKCSGVIPKMMRTAFYLRQRVSSFGIDDFANEGDRLGFSNDSDFTAAVSPNERGWGVINPSSFNDEQFPPEELEQVKFHQKLREDFVKTLQELPPSYQGKGIVICGGGIRYFTWAWICINILRKHGCSLPIQLWHLGKSEMSEEMRTLAKCLEVETVDAEKFRATAPARILDGCELKAYAILNSPFREVLFLEADNICVRNPEYLFSDSRYLATGAVFWPDYLRLNEDRKIWSVCRVPFQDEPEFETGQILVDKAKCGKALQLTMHLNEYSDFYYRYTHGDKETFHMAWRMLAQEYSMPKKPVHRLTAAICQHDFNGDRLFQNRNLAKWSLFSQNITIEDFQLEAECLKYLGQLRKILNPFLLIPRYNYSRRTYEENISARELMNTVWIYYRVGYDYREIGFTGDGLVSIGSAAQEVFWDVINENGIIAFYLSSENKVTCRLIRGDDGVWRGSWLIHEKMPIELHPRFHNS